MCDHALRANFKYSDFLNHQHIKHEFFYAIDSKIGWVTIWFEYILYNIKQRQHVGASKYLTNKHVICQG